MRNFTLLKRLAVLPLAAVLAFTSCENKKMDSSCTVTSSDIDLKASPVKVTAPAEGKIYKLNVQVSGDVTWTAKSNNTNLATVSKTDIQNTSGELLITVTSNTTYSSRNGVVTIESPALHAPISINITQPAAGAPIVHVTLLEGKNALEIKATGDILRYEITSEPVTPLTYQIDPASTEWISTVEGKTTEWVFANNGTTEPRSSWVAIKYNSGNNAVDTIYFTQNGMGKPAISISENPVGSFEIKDVKGAKTIDGIDYTEKDFAFTITTLPITGLTYKSDAEWLVKKTGAELTWTVNENITTSPRTAKLYIEYGAKNYKLDSITFVQKGTTSAKTPTVTVADGDNHARMATLKWATTPDILGSISTMHIKVGGGDVIDVAVDKGMLKVAIAPNTEYDIVATATTKDGKEAQAYEGSFTSKKLTDTYIFKDGKVKENLAAWLSAKRSPLGVAMEQKVFLKDGGITYDTLEMVTDLKLSYQFGQTAGMVDLIQCPNIVNIQVGRSWYANGVGFDNIPLFKESFIAVLTKANFPKIEKVGIGKDVTIDGTGNASMTSAVKAAVKEVCTTNGITFVDEGIALLWPNEPAPLVPNTEGKKVTNISELNLASRSAWKAVAWSSAQALNDPAGDGGGFPAMFDGDIATHWHSCWTGVYKYPQGFIIDMGAPTTIGKIVMGMRQNGNEDSRVSKYTIEFSDQAASQALKDGADYALRSYPGELGVWPGNITGFTWSNPVEITNNTTSGDNWYSIFTMPTPKTARSIRITVTYVKNPLDFSFNLGEFGVIQ